MKSLIGLLGLVLIALLVSAPFAFLADIKAAHKCIDLNGGAAFPCDPPYGLRWKWVSPDRR